MSHQHLEDLRALHSARFYFVHHSVGHNILDGLRGLCAQTDGAGLQILSLAEARATEGPVLAHGSGGKNTQPKSKIDFFASSLRAATEPAFNVAFLKLCYVDFNPRTDVDDLLAYYAKTIDGLKAELSRTTLAHVTVPLTARPTDAKARIYRLIGREVWEDAANVKRHQFNIRLAERFRSDAIFDLARVESTGPAGDRPSFTYRGQTLFCLHPRYTDDGGHLNDLGRAVAAKALVRFLAMAVADKA